MLEDDQKGEKDSLSIEILRWESKLMSAEFYSGKQEKDLDNLHEETQLILEKIINVREYDYLNNKFGLSIIQEGLIRTHHQLKKIRIISDHPLYSHENKAISNIAKYLFYQLKGFSSEYVEDDFIKSYSYVRKQLDLLESHPELITKNLERYIATLHNFMVAATRLKKQNDFFYALKQLRAIPERLIGYLFHLFDHLPAFFI